MTTIDSTNLTLLELLEQRFNLPGRGPEKVGERRDVTGFKYNAIALDGSPPDLIDLYDALKEYYRARQCTFTELSRGQQDIGLLIHTPEERGLALTATTGHQETYVQISRIGG